MEEFTIKMKLHKRSYYAFKYSYDSMKIILESV